MFKLVDGELIELTAEEVTAFELAQSQGRLDAIKENLERCAQEAKQRLLDTDWSQLADVTPILLNKVEFDAYRAALRQFVLNPVANPVWPNKPSAQWTT